MIQQCYRRDLNHSKVIKSCAKSSSNANIEGPAVAKRIKQRLSDHDQTPKKAKRTTVASYVLCYRNFGSNNQAAAE